MTKTKYIIKDWADNILHCGSGVPYTFDSFEDGWAFIYDQFDEEDYEDLFVVETKELLCAN